MLLLECPRCHNRMKYQPAKGSQSHSGDGSGDLSAKFKKCVYCNFSMNAGKSVVQKV